MSKANATENDYVKHIFNAVALPAYGANLQVNFHTADPGEAGVATTNAPTYTDYAAVAVARDTAGWTICDPDGTPNPDGSAAKNTAEVTLIECNASFVGTETLTHGSISVVATGQILYSGAFTQSIIVSALMTPRLPAGTAIFLED
jgi:hypothetical protein